jgi:hypothetical protein
MLVTAADLVGGRNGGGFGHAHGFECECTIQQLGHSLS